MSHPGFNETIQEQLTRQFFEWEVRGRGWAVYDNPVEIEPPFRPFFGHFITQPYISFDDARRPTFWSALADRLTGSPPPPIQPTMEIVEAYARPDDYSDELSELRIILPTDSKVTQEATEQLLLSVGDTKRPLSFEVIGTARNVSFQIACSHVEQRQLSAQIRASFPDVQVAPVDQSLRDLLRGKTGNAVVDFGLSREFMRPVRVFSKYDPDPLASIVGVLGDLEGNDVAALQILYRPADEPWTESILCAVTDGGGDSFFADDSRLPSQAADKISAPLFAVIVRVAVGSETDARAWRIAEHLARTMRQYADPIANEFIPLSNAEYPLASHVTDVLDRRSRRCGMLLNLNELSSLVHLPAASIRSSKLSRDGTRTKGCPGIALGHKIVLGENPHAGKLLIPSLSTEQRLKHMHVVGASGTGKSTLLLNLIVQDMRNGAGIAVLDPHGDLIDDVLARVPEERIDDVILFDPADEAKPVGLNILAARTEIERTLLASDLVGVFKRFSTSWGDQMTTVLANAVLAFLESTRGGSLGDLRRFLVEPGYREAFLETVRDPDVVYFWRKEFPLLTGRPQGSILTRLDSFLRPKSVRNVVCQTDARLDLGSVMNDRKIFLAKLSQGLIGEENSYLLGAMLVSKLNQMAISRQGKAPADRAPFFVYMDEFHNFITPSLSAILSGARKYGLGLVLAHQDLQQLAREPDVAASVISNAYSRVCFRLGDTDARKLQDGFVAFAAKDLQNLGVGEAVCRIERAEFDFNLRVALPSHPDPEDATSIRDHIVEESRRRYGGTPFVREMPAASTPTPEAAPTPPRREARKTRQAESVNVEIPPPLPAGAGVPDAGRGGPQHKYIQDLIKQWGEPRGYKVEIEKQVLGGVGWVDVVLRKNERAIACEISITTPTEHEVGNVQKCLAAGFDQVVVVSTDKKILSKMRGGVAEAVPLEQRKKISYLTPEELFLFLESAAGVESSTHPASNPRELLTAKELEGMLRIDVKTIYSYVQRGLIPYVRMQSNLRFVRSEIIAWMAEKGYKPRSVPTKKH